MANVIGGHALEVGSEIMKLLEVLHCNMKASFALSCACREALGASQAGYYWGYPYAPASGNWYKYRRVLLHDDI